MRPLAIILCLCGIWFLWSAQKIDADSHHSGSVLRLIARDEAMRSKVAQGNPQGQESQALAWKIEKSITEGQHGYDLLERSLMLLVLSGCSLIAASMAVFYFSSKKPTQPPRPTP
jgi:hypothetical protein